MILSYFLSDMTKIRYGADGNCAPCPPLSARMFICDKKTESPVNVDKRGIILRINLYFILIFRTFKSDKNKIDYERRRNGRGEIRHTRIL